MASNSSNSSGGEGNTITSPTTEKKQISPAKRWCFTLNNWTAEDGSSIVLKFQEIGSVWVVGKEVGESGTPHLQGYIEFKNKCRPKNLLCDRIHWEKAKGDKKQNYDYCSKDGDILTVSGFPKPIKLIQNLYPFQERILELIRTEPDDRTIYWFWDEEGNIGKTSFMKYCVVKHNALPAIGGKFSDIMNLVFNQDMDKSNTVMFNIPRKHKNYVDYAALESIKDGLVVNTKYETGYKAFNPPHIIVFANFPPLTEHISADRWVVENLGEDKPSGDGPSMRR